MSKLELIVKDDLVQAPLQVILLPTMILLAVVVVAVAVAVVAAHLPPGRFLDLQVTE